jgi:hypothetical protein
MAQTLLSNRASLADTEDIMVGATFSRRER